MRQSLRSLGWGQWLRVVMVGGSLFGLADMGCRGADEVRPPVDAGNGDSDGGHDAGARAPQAVTSVRA